MRILGIDVGEKRCGIAVSDPRETIATPLETVALSEAVNATGSFARLLEDWEPGLIVIGLPLTLSGEEGPQARRVRAIAGQISKASGVGHVFADERLSSLQARGSLHDMGYDGNRMKGKVDMLAACFFLQSWLDARKGEGLGPS